MILNDERLEVVRVNMLDGTMEVTTESLKANLQSYVSMRNQRDTCLEDIEKLRKTLIKTQNLADELMEYQVKYNNLTNHIRLKAENNPGVSRYIDLVNYIDRLERD
ncbi:hypothetical protein NGH54_12820 [Staphylococcus xylosus]|uniref:hypothetical protein n=1 Tax=Staphylococcus xylosus TaxID=1288 RepID=UPI002DBA038B|nr:hypothetical protein [Staphylococcus xylosus]MEB8071600.1 hypothetical protein [Staphylococcus xylosus]